MFKKILSALLVSATVVSLVSCAGESKDTSADSTPADTTLGTTAETTAETNENDSTADTEASENVPTADITAVALLDALKAAGENMTLANVYDSTNSPLSAINFVSSFGGEVDFDENFEPIYPEVMNKIAEYAFLMPVGKSPIEIDVFKVKNAADVEEVKDLCEDRIQKIKESDIKVYSPDVCDLIFPLMTVYAKGNYVMMISVENPDAVKAAADTALAVQ